MTQIPPDIVAGLVAIGRPVWGPSHGAGVAIGRQTRNWLAAKGPGRAPTLQAAEAVIVYWPGAYSTSAITPAHVLVMQ